MNNSLTSLPAQRMLVVCATWMALAGTGCGDAPPQPGKQGAPAKVEVRALEIRPSLDRPLHRGVGYVGKFRLIHHEKVPLKIDCSERPIGQRYLPSSVQLQIQKNGVWERVERNEEGWVTLFEVPPNVPCEMDVDLGDFPEQDAPLTCRVIFNWDKYPSEPFVLDWKADRKAGKFLAAKGEYIEKLRSTFLKSGFRPELLKGDDFPRQIFKKMLTDLTTSETCGKWFSINEGDIDVLARIFWNGDVLINIVAPEYGPKVCYGIFRWNPDEINRSLLKKLRRDRGMSLRSLKLAETGWG